MTITKLINSSFLAFLLLAFLSQAKAEDDISNQQDWIIRQQQNFLEEKRRGAEFEEIKKEHERKKQEAELKQDGLKISGEMDECFLIKEIKLIDANSFSKREQKKILHSFLNQCFTAKILQDVVFAVNNFYHKHGYVTTQVLVSPQNAKSGILELKVIEGKIEQISFGQDSFTDKMQKFTAFGIARGKILNANDISQGIQQINRLSSNSATMQIEPGSSDGLSKIKITNNKKLPVRATISRDNSGNNFTGIRRTNFSGSLENTLFLNDIINLNYTTNLNDDSQKKELKSFSSGISIPFTYSTISYDYSHSEFMGLILKNDVFVRNSGYSQQNKFGLERVLLSSGKARLALSGTLTKKEAASYQNKVKQQNSERNLTIGNIALSASFYPNDSTSLYLKPSYSQGLKILNSQQDQKNISKETERSQFHLLKLYANFSKKFTLPKLGAPLLFVSEMDSQYSQNTLFGSEQFSVGGYYSVRGFRENYINGDSGYYFRNKLNANLGSLLLPLIGKENSVNFSYLNKFKFEPFYDYGHTKYRYLNAGADGRLSGAGIKTIFESKNFNASLTYSWAVNKSHLTNSPEKENKIIFFEIGASCC